jgi:hypothetical protein
VGGGLGVCSSRWSVIPLIAFNFAFVYYIVESGFYVLLEKVNLCI